MVIYTKTVPLVKRIPTVIDNTDKVQRWDDDNLYPQRMNELASRAYTLNAVLKVMADFRAGEGFTDEEFGKIVVNNDSFIPQTFNDILNGVSEQISAFKTPCLHFGYNLNYTVSSIRLVDIEYVRFGLPNAQKAVTHLRYSTNWERSYLKEVGDRKVETYKMFNPDPEVVKLEIEEAGGIENYKGQILFLTPSLYQYPKHSADPVSDHAQTQAELGVFKKSSVQNRFAAIMAILYSGDFESNEEKEKFNRLISAKTGAAAAGSNIGIWDKSGTKKVNELFMPITPTNTDKLFELTEKSCVDAIIENEGIPKILVGIQKDGAMFKQEDIEDAYTYYNARTRKIRKALSRVFSYIATTWQDPIETDAAITDLSYLGDTGAQGGVEPVEGMKDLSGRGNQGLNRIIREFKEGKTDLKIATAKIKAQFGLTDEQAAAFLDDNPDNDPTITDKPDGK